MTARTRSAEILLTTCLALCTLAATVNQYEMRLLPERVSATEANAIAANGERLQVAGRAVWDNGAWRAAYWFENQIGEWEVRDLPVSDPNAPSEARDTGMMPDGSWFVGYGGDPLGKRKASFWTGILEDYQLTQLPTQYEHTEANAAAYRGMGMSGFAVAGVAAGGPGIPPDPIVWQMSDDMWFEFPLPSPSGVDGPGEASDVLLLEDNSFFVIGSTTDLAQKVQPTVWEELAFGEWDGYTLPLPDGAVAGALKKAAKKKATARGAAHDRRKAKRPLLGWVEMPGAELHAARWDFDGEQWSIQDLGMLPGDHESAALGGLENGSTILIGTSWNANATAAMWVENASSLRFDLNDLVVGTPPVNAQIATGVSPTGVIVGNGCFSSSTCVELPGARGGSMTQAFVMRPSGTTVDVETGTPGPSALRLDVSVAPNPFNPSVRVLFHSELAGHGELVVHDGTGRLVRTLVHGDVTAGDHRVTWDGRTDAGEPAAAGAYFLTLRVAGEHATARAVLVK